MSYGTFILIDAINEQKYLKGGDDAFELFINGYNGITVNNNITNHNSDKILFNFDGNSMNIDKNSFIITNFNAKKISENDNENENNNNNVIIYQLMMVPIDYQIHHYQITPIPNAPISNALIANTLSVPPVYEIIMIIMNIIIIIIIIIIICYHQVLCQLHQN